MIKNIKIQKHKLKQISNSIPSKIIRFHFIDYLKHHKSKQTMSVFAETAVCYYMYVYIYSFVHSFVYYITYIHV